MVLHLRAVAIGSLLAVFVSIPGFGDPQGTASAATETASTLTAYLDGKAIPLAEVSKYYCDDYSYPVIICSSSSFVPNVRTTLLSLLASVDYVSIFENGNYQGTMMNVSQDYPALSLLGWNDKISSFKARNSETGRFYTDWLYAGSQWSFCCNSQLSSLGGYDNTFSSVQRT